MINIGVKDYNDVAAPRARVVILPHAGGSASYFRDWGPFATQFDLKLSAVQYPGHEELFNHKTASSLEEMATAVASAITNEAETCVIFGHSMGGLLAHLVAVELQQAGHQLAGLHISGSRAPSQPVASPRHVLSDADLVTSIGDMSPGEPNVLEDEALASVLLPQVRHEMKLAETHVRGPEPLTIPITLHLGDSDPDFTPDDVPTWADFTTATIDVVSHQGHHFYLKDTQEEILEHIHNRLLKL